MLKAESIHLNKTFNNFEKLQNFYEIEKDLIKIAN
jgi:hypothetical protein